MAIIKKFAPFQNLTNYSVFLNDTDDNSQYFRITELPNTLTGGKNGFLIEGSEFLKETSDIRIEILDVNGNPVYFEPGDGTPEYYEGISKLVSAHVYDDTPIGLGKITILGELKEYVNSNGTTVPVPDEWKGIYNVKWERRFKINNRLANESIVRFYRRPTVSITELVRPVFQKQTPQVTQSGSVIGISEQPISGQNLTTWTANTIYRLQITDSTEWSSSIEDNVISIPSLDYNPTVVDVLNSKEVLVDTPYTINNIVSDFDETSYTSSFEYFEGQVISGSVVTGSFAKIDFSNLKTFVGDVARVKVFRKSRNKTGDYEFTQDVKLESTELLRDINSPIDTEISYGFLSQYNLDTYWETSSIDHVTTINDNILYRSIKVDYDTGAGGIQNISTVNNISISSDVEYTLSFKVIMSGSIDESKQVTAYLSSSDFTQDFVTIKGDALSKNIRNISTNIISDNTGDAKLVFEVTGDDWYISNVSLRNAQDTSFSPDEFTLIQDVPRKLETETFDFRFEFYDINNNFIPVDVFASAEFDGGNDFPTSTKSISLESDKVAFRFISGSTANPSSQIVNFTTELVNLTGDVTYFSSAFDENGVYIDPSDYFSSGSSIYPGFLTSYDNEGAILDISNFSGSVDDVIVGSVTYTASLDGFESYQTIYRLVDGTNPPSLLVNSNANQFIYEPSELRPKPQGQTILIRARRNNLGSPTTEILINSSSTIPTPPPLTFVGNDAEFGVSEYSITATDYSSSFSGNSLDETTYFFTSSDAYGNSYYDKVTLSPVINFDGITVVATNENTTFPADSVGNVLSSSLAASSGSIVVYNGSTLVPYDENLSPNTFDMVSISGSGCIPNGGQGSNPPINEYGITSISQDDAVLTLNITYLAGDGITSGSFVKKVNYSRNRRQSPNPQLSLSPTSQQVSFDGVTYGTPNNIVVTVKDGNTSFVYSSSLSGPNQFRIDGIDSPPSSSIVSNELDTFAIISPGTPTTPSGYTNAVTMSYVDSEGTVTNGQIIFFNVGIASSGDTGPGPVTTGVWESGRSYQFDGTIEDGSGRRDVVIWSATGTPPYDTHYVVTGSHASTNDGNGSTGRPDLGGPWLSLGTDDFFVASKVALFKPSYSQTTLNIGTNNTGSPESLDVNNLTINGQDNYPYISIGQGSVNSSQLYGSTGIFIGSNDSSKNGSIGDGDMAFSIKGNGSSFEWSSNTGLSSSGSWAHDGQLTTTGDVIAFFSDERLKTNLGIIDNPLDKVKSLSGFRYTFNNVANELGYNGRRIHIGLSAQEVNEVLPEVVFPAPFDMDDKGGSKSGKEYLTVQYDKLVPLLIESIKELSGKVDKLEAEIKELKK